jgi:hypothetical protein
MPNEGESAGVGPQRGSPRVQSWIRTVINPLRDAIAYEIILLERGSLTWSSFSIRPERLKPILGYVGDSRYALEDFERSSPNVVQPLKEHDRLLDQATEAAARAHQVTVARPGFRALVMRKLEEYEASHDRIVQRPSGAYEPNKLPELVADRMINNDGQARAPYTDADFWNSYREAFMAHAAGPEFERLRAATAALLDHDRVLLGHLSDWHYDLVQKFDVDPV